MKNWKIWALLLLLAAAIIGFQLRPKTQIAEVTSPPAAPVEAETEPTAAFEPTLTVEKRLLQPVTQRMGINITPTDYALAHELIVMKSLRPLWLRDSTGGFSQQPTTTAQFLDLNAKVQANPWLLIPANLTDADLTALGELIAEKTREHHFTQIMLENVNDQDLEQIAFAAGPRVNVIKAPLIKDSPLPKDVLNAVRLNYAQVFTPELDSDLQLGSRGLLIQMMNQILGGSFHPMTPNGEWAEKLTTAALRSRNNWSVALASNQPEPMQVTLLFPDDGRQLPTYAQVLGETEEETNGKKPLQIEGRAVSVTLPANGFLILASEAVTEAK